jgi:hypothetical protein
MTRMPQPRNTGPSARLHPVNRDPAKKLRQGERVQPCQLLIVKAFDEIWSVLTQGESDSVERVVSALHLQELLHRIAG